VLKFLLIAILLILVARAFWRVVDGILEAARGGGGAAGQARGSTAVKLVRDPVCGTYVPPRSALSITSSGTTHYFCSEACRAAYQGRTG
jgi:YHS domain-containing protein